MDSISFLADDVNDGLIDDGRGQHAGVSEGEIIDIFRTDLLLSAHAVSGKLTHAVAAYAPGKGFFR